MQRQGKVCNDFAVLVALSALAVAMGCGGQQAAQAVQAGADGGTNMSCPGGCLVTLASGQASAWAVAVDATSVYWLDTGGNAMLGGSVMKVPIGGGAAVTLASGLEGGTGIGVNATSICWLASSAMMRMPLGGGTPVSIGPAAEARS